MAETTTKPNPENPANAAGKPVLGADFIPMNAPQQMLEVPPIEGYVLYWFADRPGRIARAINGGYQFVSPSELKVNNFGLAEDIKKSGNTDLGDRVSLHGGQAENGGSERLYLMKVKKEIYEKSQALLAERNESVAASIRGGGIGDDGKDSATRYLDKKRTAQNLFTKKSGPRAPTS